MSTLRHNVGVDLMSDNITALQINTIKKKIYTYIQEGVIDSRVINILKYNHGFIPKECELWDFKRKPSGETIYLAKTILQIVSFYNSYGGYLIYGVEELQDKSFVPTGIENRVLDVKQITDKLRSYTGSIIDISANTLETTINNWTGNITILHIPKRPKRDEPVFFGRNGPLKPSGKLLFKEDEAYIRLQDNCVPVREKAQMSLLYGNRQLEFYDYGVIANKQETPLFNNLPDRNLICPKFIGRDKIIEKLWAWLGDPLSYTKLLAGDGGKGKTSIAFEFSEEICKSRPYDFERIVWLTAKKQQFVGQENIYRELPETHFFDLNSLLIVLSEELGVLEEDVEGATTKLIKKTIKEHLRLLPSFIVIDDLDTLELEEQRRVLETTLQLSGGKSRFLLTTRMNVSYSGDICITVPGFHMDDYKNYISIFCERFSIKVPNKDIKKLHEITDGSPMFTESLLRLVKLGIPLHKAINEWKEKKGDDARKAALMREIKLISPESKRVLFALSKMSETSATELRNVTGYSIDTFEVTINELSSLFLISSPPIIESEKRYRVSSNTARLVCQHDTKLISDPRVIEKQIKDLRKVHKNNINITTRRLVGKAINQAIALLLEDRADEAVETIDTTLKKIKSNRDLIFTKARCLLQTSPPRVNEARNLFRVAYEKGQRKEEFFSFWYSAEEMSNCLEGMIEVCNNAIVSVPKDQIPWLQRRVFSYWNISTRQHDATNYSITFDYLKNGIKDLVKMKRILKDRYLKEQAKVAITMFNDKLWELSLAYNANNKHVIRYDIAFNAINYGDLRDIWYIRLVDVIRDLINETQTFTDTARNFLIQHISKLEKITHNNRDKFEKVEVYNIVYDTLNIFNNDIVKQHQLNSINEHDK